MLQTDSEGILEPIQKPLSNPLPNVGKVWPDIQAVELCRSSPSLSSPTL